MFLGETFSTGALDAVLADGTIGYEDHADITEGKGQWLVMVFYPADFTFVCPTEILSLNNHEKDFTRLDAHVWAISTDTVYSHKKWRDLELGKLWFSLVSDANHMLSSQFECLDTYTGLASRCTVIVDPSNVIRYYSLVDNGVGRSTEEILRVLAALQAVDRNEGCVACAEWKEGDELIVLPTN